MSIPTGFTDHPEYADMVINRLSCLVGNQVAFIGIMVTAGVLSSTRWTDTVFKSKVIHELFIMLKRGKFYIIKLAKDCKFSYHDSVKVGMLFFTFLPNKILAPMALVSGKERVVTGEVRDSFFSIFCTLV